MPQQQAKLKIQTALVERGNLIGISSVITITAVGQGVQKLTELQIQALGTNVMLVTVGAARTGGISQGAGSASTLTWEDAKAIAKPKSCSTKVRSGICSQSLDQSRSGYRLNETRSNCIHPQASWCNFV